MVLPGPNGKLIEVRGSHLSKTAKGGPAQPGADGTLLLGVLARSVARLGIQALRLGVGPSLLGSLHITMAEFV